jgi:hypothetical protein
MGFLSNPLVISAINLIEQHLDEDQSSKKVRHKLSFLMIESFQNILRYGDEPINKKLDYQKEMFLVRNIGGTFYIGSVNLIENQKVNYVQTKLNEVNDLDEEDLHQLYRKILTNNKFTDAGGAGLGFIEMARKTNQKLQYDFIKINEEYSYFYLLIRVKIEPDSIENLTLMDISWVKNLHTQMCHNHIVMLHKGNYSPEVIDPVIFIVENNIISEAINVQKLTFNVIREAIDNVSHHSMAKNEEKEAIFIIGKKDNENYISTGNYIESTKVVHLEEQLDLISKLSPEALQNLYSKTLEKKKNRNDKKIAIGLLEIAVESKNRINYQFSKIDNEISFYTFDVIV